jgi:hypothetical protein
MILSPTSFQASLNISVASSYLFLIVVTLIGVVACIGTFTTVISIAVMLSGRIFQISRTDIPRFCTSP